MNLLNKKTNLVKEPISNTKNKINKYKKIKFKYKT